MSNTEKNVCPDCQGDCDTVLQALRLALRNRGTEPKETAPATPTRAGLNRLGMGGTLLGPGAAPPAVGYPVWIYDPDLGARCPQECTGCDRLTSDRLYLSKTQRIACCEDCAMDKGLC